MDPRETLNHVKTSWDVQVKEHLLVCVIHKVKCYFMCPFLCHVGKKHKNTWETSMDVKKYDTLNKRTVEE